MSKLDGSAKGGMIAAVQAELNLPTVFLGRGERLEDLKSFSAPDFIEEFFVA
jgi:fused signal recognition particle receptor